LLYSARKLISRFGSKGNRSCQFARHRAGFFCFPSTRRAIAWFFLGVITMSVTLPNGSIIAIASGVAAADSITAITNASPAVATTSGAHGFVAGDLVRITSGWSRLTDKVVRVGVVGSSTTFELEDYDTTDTDVYPAGSGTGTAELISGWTQLSQILASSSSGGEQQFLEYQFLEADAQKRIPTFKNAAGLTFSIADDPSLPGYQLASVANDDRDPRGVRITLANGSVILYLCYISLNKTPTLTVNELMACEVTMSMLNEPMRYAD
jgi:hypothetical protein